MVHTSSGSKTCWSSPVSLAFVTSCSAICSGFRNELKQHGLKTAILHKGSWFSMLLGGVILVWYVFPLVLAQDMGSFSITNPLLLVGAALLVIGLILLLMGEGMLGIIEITNPLSHTLSYTRLLAVGLSSVGIAFAINTIALMLVVRKRTWASLA